MEQARATLGDVLHHYDNHLSLSLSDQEKRDLIEYDLSQTAPHEAEYVQQHSFSASGSIRSSRFSAGAPHQRASCERGERRLEIARAGET
jgi:hypothetical protein